MNEHPISTYGKWVLELKSKKDKIIGDIKELRKQYNLKKVKSTKRAFSQMTPKQIDEYYTHKIHESRILQNKARDNYLTTILKQKMAHLSSYRFDSRDCIKNHP